MTDWFKRRMPTRESVQNNRWLRWLGPTLHQPRLWHMSRKGIALGMAIGIFFGLLIPIAQIPFAAATAVLLRANLPTAIGSTLVTNPVTFGPVYYAAYRTGVSLVGEESSAATSPEEVAARARADSTPDDVGVRQQLWHFWRYLTGVGKPLVVGLAVFAVAGGLLVYALTSLVWVARTRWRRRQRLKLVARRKGLK
ncbi:MAG: DUF2062 domain-containing protein [Burkholderiaceae bacterium]|jgi:hypothetical protein|nr:DUF2062 domain-containing protein [Burkholderiaceae bacterium]